MKRNVAAFILTITVGLALVRSSANAGDGMVVASVIPQPLAVTIEEPVRAVAGKPFQLSARVRNAGSEPVVAVTAELRVDAVLIGGRHPVTTVIQRINGGHDHPLSWLLCADRPGNYIAIARVQSRKEGVLLEAESAAALISVKAGKRDSCPAGW